MRLAAIGLVCGAFVLAVVGWLVAGWVAQAVGVGELNLPARAGGVFLALSLGEKFLRGLPATAAAFTRRRRRWLAKKRSS